VKIGSRDQLTYLALGWSPKRNYKIFARETQIATKYHNQSIQDETWT
jgi:hypothetical protein